MAVRISYKSSNTKIALVSKLTGKKTGKKVILVTVALNNGIKKTFKTTVAVK